jgi:predicted nucleic acid-binding protein
MLIHLDTSVLVDAFTGTRRALSQLAAATTDGHVLTFCSVVQYEWLRGSRRQEEDDAVHRFFGDSLMVSFGSQEAHTAAALFKQVKRARQRQADLAIAACALEHNARLWTLNASDFVDVPGLMLYQPGSLRAAEAYPKPV